MATFPSAAVAAEIARKRKPRQIRSTDASRIVDRRPANRRLPAPLNYGETWNANRPLGRQIMSNAVRNANPNRLPAGSLFPVEPKFSTRIPSVYEGTELYPRGL